MMLVEEFSNDEIADELELFVSQSPTSLIYSTPAFMAMIADHLVASAHWLVLRNQGDIAAVLPYLVKQTDLGSVYNSLAYYGSNGGVIQIEADPEAKKRLIEYFYELAQRNGALSATLISNPLESFEAYETFSRYSCRDERIGQISHLPDKEHKESLISLFDDPRPRNIRKAIREGVTVRAERSAESIDFLFRTHKENISAIGGLSKREEFFKKIPIAMPGDKWNIFIGSINGEPVSALLVFYHNSTVEYFTPVIVEKYRSFQPLALVVYEAMRDAIDKGFKNWNWGGTWLSQGGVYDFKKKWGTVDYPYYYYTRIFSPSLRQLKREQLLLKFEGFFVLPFAALEA